MKITPEQKNAYRTAASNELRNSLRDETVYKERENLRSKVLEFSSYLSEVNEDISSAAQLSETKGKYRLKSFDDYNGKYYIERQQEIKEAVESTNDVLEHQRDIISDGGGGFSGSGGDGGGPPEDPLKKMIALLKEYYDLCIKIASPSISANVKKVYESQRDSINQTIEALEKSFPGTKEKGLSDFGVSLKKAKYEDLIDSQNLKDLEKAKKLYQDYLDAVSQLQLLNRENYFAYATKQDNTELQKKVDAQN